MILASVYHVIAVLWEKTPVKIRLQELGLDNETCAQFKRIGLKEHRERNGVRYETVRTLRVQQNRYVDIL